MGRLRFVRVAELEQTERRNPMTIDRIIPKEVVEKGSDADLLREMIAVIADRLGDRAPKLKKRAWLITALTVSGENGFVMRNAGSGRSPVSRRSG
jgi:hypothetical protein